MDVPGKKKMIILLAQFFKCFIPRRYQCSYCFYRSYDYHIVTHTKNYHSLEPCSAINCKPTRVLNSKHELDEVWKNFFSTCRPMSCVGEYFYWGAHVTFKNFIVLPQFVKINF